MIENELFLRVQRIYAAIKASKEFNMGEMPAKVIKNGNFVGFFPGFFWWS